jgi:hypothetical protein
VSAPAVARDQNMKLVQESLGRTQTRDSSPTVMRSKFIMSVESLGQGPLSLTTCRRVWSGFAMDGSGSITLHLVMRF